MTTVTREDLERVWNGSNVGISRTRPRPSPRTGCSSTPHYPEPEFRGHDEIREAFEWVFENVIDDIDLTIRNFWASGLTCAAEVETRQLMKNGSEHEFSQAFIAEFDDELRLVRLQAYLPYGPPE